MRQSNQTDLTGFVASVNLIAVSAFVSYLFFL